MTFLVTIAIISFLVTGTVLASSFYFSASGSREVPVGVSDVAILTYREALDRLERWWHMFLPLVHHAITAMLSRYLAFRDRTYTRIFGQAAVPRGGATSYFLKRIIAHKEDFQKKRIERESAHTELKENDRGHMFAHLRSAKTER